MIKRVIAFTALLAALLMHVSGCCRVQTPEEIDFFAMDTFMQLEAYGENASKTLSECQAEIRRIESLLSVSSASGDIYRINHAAGEPVPVTRETTMLLSEAVSVCAETDGAFDPTVYPLVANWGFFNNEQHVPEPQHIASLLPLVGWENISIAGQTVTIPNGAGIDLGGIAKGYATDRLVSILRQGGVESALLSLGGNVYAFGGKPDGSAWHIAIQNPADAASVIGTVAVKDLAVITSGIYQRNFTVDGVTYHHILDPKTGYPANTGLSSVTIICKNAARADALSTALFVMGYDRAISFWRNSGDFAAIFVDLNGTVRYTENAIFVPLASDAIKISK